MYDIGQKLCNVALVPTEKCWHAKVKPKKNSGITPVEHFRQEHWWNIFEKRTRAPSMHWQRGRMRDGAPVERLQHLYNVSGASML